MPREHVHVTSAISAEDDAAGVLPVTRERASVDVGREPLVAGRENLFEFLRDVEFEVFEGADPTLEPWLDVSVSSEVLA